MLIKILVLNLQNYRQLVLGGLEISFYLLNFFLSTYSLTLVKPLPLTKIAELAELPNREPLD